MADVVQFPRAERPSKADLAFFPIPSQESIDQRERLAVYEVALRKTRNWLLAGIGWLFIFAGIGLAMGL